MSSILKALKKIEGRKVETRLPIWRNQSDNRQTLDSQINRSRQRQKLLMLLIIICGIAIAMKLYSGWRGDSENGISENRSGSNMSTTDPTVRKKITAAIKSPASPPAPDTATAPLQPSSETSVATVPAAATTPSEAPAKSAPQAETAKAPPISPEPPSPTETEVPTAPPAAEPSESRTVEIFDPAPANNAGLTLHALVWAENPDERFVVINGDIHHEGDTIEEVTIVRIERNYVVMKSKAGTWKFR